jgi:hypothetical protein
MALKVQIKHPTQGPDTEFAIPGAGMVKNGDTVTLDADQELMAFSMVGMSIKDYYKDDEMVTVTGTSEVKLPKVESASSEPEAEADEGSDS